MYHVTFKSLKAHNAQRARFNLNPLSSAEFEAQKKGWSRAVRLESQRGHFVFESTKTKEGTRCVRTIIADNIDDAVKKLIAPVWN